MQRERAVMDATWKIGMNSQSINAEQNYTKTAPVPFLTIIIQ